MKKIFLIFLTSLTLTVSGQDKYNYLHFNKLTEIEGTEYMVASIEDRGKMNVTMSKYLLFINTKTGDTNQVDFPNDAWIGNLEHVKLDS
jgi:hypothetical protein